MKLTVLNVARWKYGNDLSNERMP